ncbi:Hypothetical_protein [Hexamita inflata]|uniref:Hypothetical_protein n=1 Tax=Hexamita inflata TaxID=28002 RepID=A0AA86QAD9_9EUKA|nr:Hypothetical protein HINF_LOCUS42981 [Hexamita inflata]
MSKIEIQETQNITSARFPSYFRKRQLQSFFLFVSIEEVGYSGFPKITAGQAGKISMKRMLNARFVCVFIASRLNSTFRKRELSTVFPRYVNKAVSRNPTFPRERMP